MAILCAWLLAYALNFLTWQPTWWHQPISFGTAVMSAAVMTFALKALKLSRGSWALAWLFGASIAALIALFAPDQQSWFIVCFTIGYGIHLVGDFMTTGGLPLLWPWIPKPPKSWANIPILNSIWSQGGYMALPVLGNAGSVREWLLLIPISIYAGYGVLFTLVSTAGINLDSVLRTLISAS